MTYRKRLETREAIIAATASTIAALLVRTELRGAAQLLLGIAAIGYGVAVIGAGVPLSRSPTPPSGG